MKTTSKLLTLIAVMLTASAWIMGNTYSQEKQPDIELTKISELKNYTDSYIKGEVIKILDEDEVRIKDSSGKIKVYTGWKNTNMVKKGEKVTVRGRQDPGFIKEFYATEIIMENGEIKKLESD